MPPSGPSTSRAAMAWFVGIPQDFSPPRPFPACLGHPPSSACLSRRAEVLLSPSGHRGSLPGPSWATQSACAHLCVCPQTATTQSRPGCVDGSLKSAQWHCDIEQLVRTTEDTYHRADISAANLTGKQFALDIAVTATPGSDADILRSSGAHC